ncbi:MAG: MarR family transcriptional regulator, lower aerobic nicotinate degradation pathway regulator [Frankiales bacterium]|jgi:DNA-binding MarR family transcriptional regulator|nr:MarR family transcriptional regulator, lower aerobic nicotinate degradation pathway regulator [Frankiales bacterium]
MDNSADPAGTSDSSPGEVTPARLRSLPSRLLTHTATHAERLVNQRLADVDARKWHYAVLAALQESGPASQAVLSRRAGLFHSDLVGVINELADRGYLDRAPDTADRRRNVITITTQGRRHLRRLDKVVAAVQDDLLAPLTEPERDQFSRMLTRLLDYHMGTPLSPQIIGEAESAHKPQLDGILARGGLTFHQWVALSMTTASGGTIDRCDLMDRITSGLKIDQETATAAIAQLIEARLLRARAGTESEVELTASGRSLHQKVRAEIDEILAKVYWDLPAEDLAMARVLTTVTDRANELADGTK